MTDEEDCSVREDGQDIFDTSAELGPLNLRCFNHRDEYVEPVESFAGALLGSGPARPIVCGRRDRGHPARDASHLQPRRHDGRGLRVSARPPEMQERIDDSPEGRGERIAPELRRGGMGQAFPPRRLVTLAREILRAGGGGNVASICEANFAPAMRRIADMIWKQLTSDAARTLPSSRHASPTSVRTFATTSSITAAGARSRVSLRGPSNRGS